MEKYTTNATFLALTTALISGVSIFMNKFAAGTVADPVLFAGLKNTLVGVFLLGLLLTYGKKTELQQLSLRQWLQLLAIGLIGGSLPFALFFTGFALIPAINGALIHKTLFLWVAFFATVFLKERLSPLQLLGMGLLFASNLFVGGFSGFGFTLGELLILAATLFWALENVVAKRALSELSSITVACARMVFGSLFLILFLMVTGRMSSIATLTLAGSGWIFLTSLFLLGYVLTWYSALKYAPASYVAALLVPATLITNVLSAVFVTHAPTIPQLLSGVLVLVGTFFVVRFARTIQISPVEETISVQ